MAPKRSVGSLIDFLAFVAIIIIGIGLLLAAVLSVFDIEQGTITDIIGLVQHIIHIFAYALIAYYSYFYAKKKGKAWYTIWVIAVIVVLVSFVFSLGYIKF